MSEDCLADGRSALARGDVLTAYDAAQRALDVDPDDLEARFLVALALAPAGSTQHVLQAVDDLRARVRSDQSASHQLPDDGDALLAGLAKDQALAATGPARVELATQAADLYEAAANRYGGSFSCSNAATLRMLTGDIARAGETRRTDARPADSPARSGG